MAKKFMYVCAGILMLTGAYMLGASQVGAQISQGNPVAGISSLYTSAGVLVSVTTDNGDVYSARVPIPNTPTFTYVGNVFDGAPVSSETETLGDVKSSYR